MVREIEQTDLHGLLQLYTQLHDNPLPEDMVRTSQLWKQILADKNHHIIIAEKDNKIISSCVLVIIPNLTHNQRPYALIENVITDIDHRKCGFATLCLNYAKEIARRNNCYKIMLLTGSRDEDIIHFYEWAGYNKNDKTAFIQWIP